MLVFFLPASSEKPPISEKTPPTNEKNITTNKSLMNAFRYRA
jgi:hypothetical protein